MDNFPFLVYVSIVKEARSPGGAGRGGGFGGGRGGPSRGRGARGSGPGTNRDFGNGNANVNSGFYGGSGLGGSGLGSEEVDPGKNTERERGPYGGPRQPFRGGRRGGYGNGDGGLDSERPRRPYERRSGTGRGYEMKREGAGRGNWGTPIDEVIAQGTEEINDEKAAVTANIPEKQTEQEDAPSSEVNKDKEGELKETEEKEGDKDSLSYNEADDERSNKCETEMTLEEYEKIREERRKALLALKNEERKVEIDDELKSMQQLSLKKGTDEVFIKLGSEKENAKKKEDRDERAKKSLSINEFLKPADGERYYSPGGRGRGRGRGSFNGGFGSGALSDLTAAPAIEDRGQFPSLGGK
ncbi:hypothetical protein AXF42_Ash009438 [Apostasia shenzhenica]|uniref:Hyaluronan/mRNA-binding protein domain-containing protein n=1 Tax=Apostasia shenzhenica TaxID=1088818 RepID=A0A2I0B8T5_9ASPA|nr:hypothetical protein AXF42_Ash009438 [Apostasia shenzhenica]